MTEEDNFPQISSNTEGWHCSRSADCYGQSLTGYNQNAVEWLLSTDFSITLRKLSAADVRVCWLSTVKELTILMVAAILTTVHILILISLFTYLGVLCRITLIYLAESSTDLTFTFVGVNFYLPNLIGSFVMGLATSLMKKVAVDSTRLSQFLIALSSGFCGSCTTFSAWQRDVSLLFWQRELLKASNQLLTTFCASYCSFLFGIHISTTICDRTFSGKIDSEGTSSERELENSEFRLITWLVFIPITIGVWVFAVILPPERKLWFVCIGLSPVGSNLRYLLSKYNPKFPHFPLFTFLVNIFGSFLAILIDSLAGHSLRNELIDQKTYALWVSGGVATGILGSLTTVSTFVKELYTLKNNFLCYRYGIISILISQIGNLCLIWAISSISKNRQ